MTPGFMPELLTESKVLFENRADAGKKLAAGLTDYTDQNAIVMAIPNGGVPLAVQVASIINADIGIMLCRKLSLPLNQEGGLGAVADDGTSIINEDIMKKEGITQEQIEHESKELKTISGSAGCYTWSKDRRPA
jgi:predicted phosphoribosyltransferase